MNNLPNKSLSELFAIGLALNEDEKSTFITEIRGFSISMAEELEKMFEVDPSELGLHDGTDSLHSKLEHTKGLEIPDSIGKFSILSILGAGGMGIVYLGQRLDVKQLVAVKVSNSLLLQGERAQAITHEAKILAALQHPNIASLVDWGTFDNQRHYVAMEYIDGLSIYDYCEQQNLTTIARIKLLMQVIDAIDYAHSNLVIHRDIKPANILVDNSGSPILIDFGVARLMKSATGIHQQTQGAALTPSYASPEQLRGESLSIRSDLYSLGAVLMYLLTGKQIDNQKEQSLLLVIQKTIDTDYQQNKNKWSKVSRSMRQDLSLILTKVLAYDSKLRYSNAFSFKKDLQSLLTLKPITAHEPSRWYWFKKFIARHKLVTGVLTIALTSIAFGGWQWYRAVQSNYMTIVSNKELESYAEFLNKTLKSMDAYSGGNPNIKMDEFMEKTVKIYQNEKNVSYHRLAYHAGVLSSIYGSWGYFKKALEVTDIGLEYAKKTPELSDDIYLLSNKALNYGNSGHPKLSVENSLKALEFVNKSPKNESKRNIILGDLTYAYNALGQHNKALEIIERILRNNNSTALEKAYANFNKANILGQHYQLKKSIKILEGIIPYYTKQYGEDSVQVFISKMMKFQFNNMLKPVPINNKKIKELDGKYGKIYHDNHPNRAMIMVFFATANFLGNQIPKAIDYQQHALDFFMSTSDKLSHDIVTSTAQIALYYILNDDIESAALAINNINVDYIDGSPKNTVAEYYLYKTWLEILSSQIVDAKIFLSKAEENLKNSEYIDLISTLNYRSAQIAALEKNYQSCYDNAKKATDMATKLYPKTWQLPNAYRYLQDVCQHKLEGRDNTEFPYLQAVLDSPWKQETVITTKILNSN